jgi:DDE superfamily endonuclease
MKLKWKKEFIIQEDSAPSHSHKYQQRVFDSFKIIKILWPGNSPDLNAIKPCWFYIKRMIIKKGVFSKKDIEA